MNQRYKVNFIIEGKDLKGFAFGMGESFIEDVKELVLRDHPRISLIHSSSYSLFEDKKNTPA